MFSIELTCLVNSISLSPLTLLTELPRSYTMSINLSIKGRTFMTLSVIGILGRVHRAGCGIIICIPCFFFYRISSSHIFNSVCWSHALVNGPTSKRPASDGGRCSGQLLMMWSAVCSGSPHSHAALSASPHFFMEALYRPTPVCSQFRVVQCFRLSSSPLTPSCGSDTWRCTRVGPDASHSCFHVSAIHASFDRSSGMTFSISRASLL